MSRVRFPVYIAISAPRITQFLCQFRSKVSLIILSIILILGPVNIFILSLNDIYIIREEASIFARKGSRSTRIPESPRVPSERYDRQPCLCVFVARFDRRIFYYSSETDSSWGCVAKVTASHLLIARPRHCLSAIHGWALPKQ